MESVGQCELVEVAPADLYRTMQLVPVALAAHDSSEMSLPAIVLVGQEAVLLLDQSTGELRELVMDTDHLDIVMLSGSAVYGVGIGQETLTLEIAEVCEEPAFNPAWTCSLPGRCVSVAVWDSTLGVVSSGNSGSVLQLRSLESGAVQAETELTDWQEGEELESFVEDLSLSTVDRGVLGVEHVVRTGGETVWRGSALDWWTLEDSSELVLAIPGDDRDVLVSFMAGGSSSVEVSGRVGGLGGDSGTLLVSVFDGTAECVFASKGIRSDSLRHAAERYAPGKVGLGRGVCLWSTRTALGGILLSGPDGSRPLLGHTSPRLCRTDRRQASPDGPSLLVHSSAPSAAFTVVHLHGGPEAYEVSEPRFFGGPTSAVALGGQWRSLNYRGSRGPSLRWVRAAWHSWRRTLTEDLRWALEDVEGPVILCGWSFGASLALALAPECPGLVGLVLGGAMVSLREHVELASSIDPAHRPWFEERFDLLGDDAEFLCAAPGEWSRSVDVISFHGREDANCSYELFDQFRSASEGSFRSWTHADLPNGAHYAESAAEAELIVRSLTALLGQVNSRSCG